MDQAKKLFGYDPSAVSPSAMQILQEQQNAMQKAYADRIDQMTIKAMMDEKIASASSAPVEYTMRIRPGVNGGFAVYMDNELFVAPDIEALPNTIIAAIGRKKIKA